MRYTSLLSAGLMALAATAFADAPRVVSAKARDTGMGWNIYVTLEHPDTGWDHYADGWDLVDAAGNILATRELHHPHVKEQPFTRSLSNVMLPDGTRHLFVRVRCSKEGWTNSGYEIKLER